MKPYRALFALSLLGGLHAATAEGLSGTSVYRGEIRRDSNGNLVAEPAPHSSVTGASSPAAKPATPASAAPGKRSSAQEAAPAGKVIRVGPQQAVRSISVAANMAVDGDTIEIESGDYVADVAVWK